MFMFKASCYLETLKLLAPEIFDKTKLAVDNSLKNMDFIKLSESEFSHWNSDMEFWIGGWVGGAGRALWALDRWCLWPSGIIGK